MRCEQRAWAPATTWPGEAPAFWDAGLWDAGLVIHFGARKALACGRRHAGLGTAYPQARLPGCRPGGQILGDDIDDDGVAVVAFRLGAGIHLATASVLAPGGSRGAGEAIGRGLAADGPHFGTMTFAGDMPQVWLGQPMHGDIERLIAGAAKAARRALCGAVDSCTGGGDRVAILNSCIGRRLLMGESTQDEIEAAAMQYPPETIRFGFHAYGETVPHAASTVSGLHNQAMTITSIAEACAA